MSDIPIDEIRAEKAEKLKDEAGDDAAPAEPVHVNGASELSAVTSENAVVLADFYADWCGPCKMIAPVMDEIAAETDAAVAKVDVDQNQQLAGQYGVQGVPTLVLFADGEPVERLVGMQNKDQLVALIERHG
ncbi:thioredoxin (plasmid) [Haloarcula salina]|uniref:thioredoxin n=1 Tax=Haloarcula salina TaxID=1429914 RepID=UPI003C6EBBCC